MNNIPRNNAAKWVGVISSMAVLGLWLVIIFYKQYQYTSVGVTDTLAIGSWIIDTVDAKMILLSLLGMLAALAQRPLIMLLVFLLMFWPVGLYTLGVPGWARLIGFLLLLFLSSGVSIFAAQSKNRKASYDK